jgi:ATP-dependent Clp protease ATP-binding subunit ClpA
VRTSAGSGHEEQRREDLHTEFALSSLGRVLTSRTELDRSFPIVGRDAEVQRLADLLASGASVLLVGESGSGKTAIVEKLAERFASEQEGCNSDLAKRHILECDHTAFQDRCLYVHEFETRFRAIITKCQATGVILFFENVHLAGGSGATEDNEDRTLATMLTPHLGSGRITVIGTTTPEGYRALVRRNPAFVNKFVKCDIAATSARETEECLLTLRSHLRDRCGVDIEAAVCGEIIRAADRFYPGKVFPGKAFCLLKETLGAKRVSLQTAGSPGGRLFPKTITVADVLETLGRQTGLCPQILCHNLPLRREEILEYFEGVVFEQKGAVDCLADAILSFKTELNDPERPIGVFLFCGPTGVGKTELACQLARYFFGSERRLRRFDMSEFADFDGMRRFLGGTRWKSTKGLADAIASQPFSVVLLDEIEKANTAIFNLLLQAFGEGRLTDLDGRTACLANCIFIMTSNLGSDLYAKGANRIGLLGTDQQREGYRPTAKELTAKVKAFFAPEFVNRVTNIVYFDPLSYETLRRVAKKEIDRVFQRHGIRCRALRISIRPALERVLLEKGFDPEYGARPMQRAVQELVVSPLAARLARADVPDQREIVLDWNGLATDIQEV